jgi:ParB/RepB/Spo0J family partition protein
MTMSNTTEMPAAAGAKKKGTNEHVIPAAGQSFQFKGLVEEEIPADQLVRYAANRVPEKAAVKAMAESLREHGQLQPITARPVKLESGEEVLEIVFGETRVLGCRAIAKDHPVRCYILQMDDKEAARIHAVENFQRKQLDAIDEARSMRNMRDKGWTIDEVAASVGMSVALIYRRLKLLDLGEEAHEQFRAGNLSATTADLIAGMPEELRAEAVRAVTNPTHSKSALPEREALSLLREEFIEPIKKTEEWNARRKLLEKENPGAKWLEYKEAKSFGAIQGVVDCENHPPYAMLSDAARTDELLVPTWGALAAKHKAEKFIGMHRWSTEAVIYVHSAPLIDAEKAACDKKPMDCIFTHEKAVTESRLAKEKKDQEEAAALAAKTAELQRLVDTIMTPGSPTKVAEKKLVGGVVRYLMDQYGVLDNLGEGRVFAVPAGVEDEVREEMVSSKVQAFIRKKELSGFEALGRLMVADFFGAEVRHPSWLTPLAEVMFAGEALKENDFPHLAAHLAKAEAAKASEERDHLQAKEAAAKADAENPTKEEA